ncbi:MAG: ATP-binding cassette domain-containing protein [Gemmataceae bacterium]|nr:ATP-binding cassette domain-containing protein [Gemmataceae bacterium]MCI0740273.1 ATP-binding cassette domain-containing protein [Gemmataceae bacterium]
MITDAVIADRVTKRFGQHVAVNELSLRVPAGVIYGFIGPNGSGKTTTLRMVMRILHPDDGSIQVLGEYHHGAANDRVGYLPEERGLYKTMKVRDLLRFYAALKGSRDSDALIASWLERMGLSDWAMKKVETLSKGMAQKVQFIAAIIAKPELVLLDEPFSGLDPVNAVVLREAILDLKNGGTTVIFSTHDMNVAEKMCDFLFMIHKGVKVLDGTLQSIQEQYGLDTVKVRWDGNGELDRWPGVVKVTDFGQYKELRLERGGDTQKLLQELAARGRVTHFEVAHPTLHDIFVRIAGAAETTHH